MFHKELAFPKGVQMWFLSVSGPKVKVGEKRRDWRWPEVEGRWFPLVLCSSLQTLQTPNGHLRWFLNHESLRSMWLWLHGNGVSRLAMGWGGSRRFPWGDRQTVRGCQQWAQIASCPSSSEDLELTSGHLVTSNIYSFHYTHRIPDTVLGSENIMLTKTDTVPALMDLRIQLGRQLVYFIRWLFNESYERLYQGEINRL